MEVYASGGVRPGDPRNWRGRRGTLVELRLEDEAT